MTSSNPPSAAPGSIESCLAAYHDALNRESVGSARARLVDALDGASEDMWLDCGRRLVLARELDTAIDVFERGTACHPASADLRTGLAGLYWQADRRGDAENMLRGGLSTFPGDVGATFLLARLLFEQGRVQGAADAIKELFEHGHYDADTAIQAVELMDDFGRAEDALHICKVAMVSHPDDPRLHAYAGMLGIQLGEFERVRTHYEFALAHADGAVEWNIPIGLSCLQRYTDDRHPDLTFFREVLDRVELSEKARTNTMFALGKALDDLADYGEAARYFRAGNARARTVSSWSRKQWRRKVAAHCAASPVPWTLPAPVAWTPVFIVGVPRSGTTLLAELMARHPLVTNRGELGWLQTLAESLPASSREPRKSFEEAASVYATHLLQDDSDAGWYIDKQPLNLLYIDLIMAWWPNAKIIYCQRDARDTALSLWSQSFQDRAHDYACDFTDIGALIQGCRRLMIHWNRRYPSSIRAIRYEDLVQSPQESVTSIVDWLGIPTQVDRSPANRHGGSIATASVWQARQPVYTGAVGRWKNYADYIPELLLLPEH
ncbi:MAG: sulfotransferase [Rhodanobacter sp.]